MSSSVMGTIVNKQIMRLFPFPVFLTVLHLVIGLGMDAVVVRQRFGRIRIRNDLIVSCVPIAVALASAKILTYVSYGNVPVSLTHTVKVFIMLLPILTLLVKLSHFRSFAI